MLFHGVGELITMRYTFCHCYYFSSRGIRHEGDFNVTPAMGFCVKRLGLYSGLDDSVYVSGPSAMQMDNLSLE